MKSVSARHAALPALCLCALVSAAALRAQNYSPPLDARADLLLDTGWRFTTNAVSGAQAPAFDDAAWNPISLPHTWNNLDGQDGGGNYYRGAGWYRVHLPLDASLAGRHFFLKFDGAFSVSDVYVNGAFLGEKIGGFAAFVFDATSALQPGADNVIAVKVSNAPNSDVPPLNADFTFFGGLYRDVHLLVTGPAQISPLDCGSPGVYLQTTGVSSNSATLQFTTVLSNAAASPVTLNLRSIVTDAATNILVALTNTVTLRAMSSSNIVVSTIIDHPHLWNGLDDPYLHHAFVELRDDAGVIDCVAQPLGFRSFNVDPTNGFFLNGRHYDLHGVNLHQDWLNCGWAVSSAQRATNFAFLKEIGATFLRLSHYEHADETYQLADQNGVCVWSEIPIIDYITVSAGFYSNTLQDLRDMIRQRYNHPSVVCWSIYNEITLQSGPNATNLVAQEAALAAQEDPTRPATAAANTSDNDPTTTFTPLIAFNKYYGWYSSPLNGIGAWADNYHATHPNRPVGITEYGAGGSIYQHSENPAFPANTSSAFHPEEWQNIVHETNWQMMAARPFLWCKLLWNAFDFASDGRSEGETPGRNDKGIATYDRLARKDVFYYYKASWTTNPMVYITGHTFTNRLTNSVIAKIYANCDTVELFLNGASQGLVSSPNCIYAWPITLQPGSNYVTATGVKGGASVTDALVWFAPVTPPKITVVSPLGSIAWLNGTNDTLRLAASVTNPVPGAPLSTTWSALAGPGAVAFANLHAPATTASFSAAGIYNLAFTADNGGTATAQIAVVVGPNRAITNGLAAWWKMDETSGALAADASGNGRNATATGAYFTNFTSGFPARALHFNGTSGAASFSSPAVTQLTLTAWARAANRGNSAFPRIFDTPGYRLFFRFDNQGSNGFDFATYSSGNGDWFSGANSIATGAWYHVAASYDLSIFSGVPSEYANGSLLTPNVITTPSGSQPSSAGTGYLGNTSALNRAWSGDLSDVRIYSRILSPAEIRVLAGEPNVNYAPTVSAGSSQIVTWPSAVDLAGAVNDDGRPASPGVVTLQWSKASGPGAVAFANASALTTTANFSAAGTYRLQLTASDGQAATVSDVTVTALPPTLSIAPASGAVSLSWPTNSGNWLLQYQTNPPAAGLGTNWTQIAGPVSNPFLAPIFTNAGSVFYRLKLTNP